MTKAFYVRKTQLAYVCEHWVVEAETPEQAIELRKAGFGDCEWAEIVNRDDDSEPTYSTSEILDK